MIEIIKCLVLINAGYQIRIVSELIKKGTF